MILRHLMFATVLSLAYYSAACQPDNSAPSSNTVAASPSNSQARTASNAASLTAAAGVNPIFVTTPDQLRAAFDEYELKGENKQTVGIGEEKSLTVTAQGAHGPESLKLRVLFLPPLEQAKAKGYSFGMVARQRTPDDRKDFENVSVSTISQRSDRVDFRVFLEQPKDDTATIPTISFELLDKDGQRVKPTTQPTSYTAGIDIITAVALAEEGQELIFPLSNATSPYLTDKMDKMRLVVSIDAVEQTLEYRLKK